MSEGRIHVGIGGWTFPPWRGPFYPKGLPQKQELAYAASRLTAIEINATFHRLQKPESFRKWASEAPDDFRFAVKASRYATNRRVLAEAGPAIETFLAQGLAELGDRLGPVLWQLAATKQFDRDDVARFLDLLPATLGDRPLAHAIEALHPSFADPAFRDLAKERGIAVAHVEAAGASSQGQPGTVAYARFKQSSEAEANGYPDDGLDRIAARARDWATGGREVFLFFIAGDKVKAPAAAQALIEKLG